MNNTFIDKSNPVYILPLSAKSNYSLENYQKIFQQYLANNSETALADIAYTLQEKREFFSCRNYVVGQNKKDIIENLNKLGNSFNVIKQNGHPESKLIFMFSGQGSQYVGMGSYLYKKEIVFKNIVDQCFEMIKSTSQLTIEHLLHNENRLDINQTQFSQPLLFIISYALSRLLESWNIKAVAYIGHSIGEYTAATLAGVFSLEDALKVVSERGRLMQSMPTGCMLSIHKNYDDIITYLSNNVEISVINAPEYCVVSGSTDEINNLKNVLNKDNIQATILHTSHAFHSKMMKEAADQFSKFLEKIPLNSPNIPFISNTTGKMITNDQATSPIYWGEHIKKPVLFSQGIKTLIESHNNAIFCEIGPGNVLSSFVKLHLDKNHKPLSAINTLYSPKQHQSLQYDLTIYEFVAKLWCYGYQIDFRKIFNSENSKNVSLPTYQFEKQRCWIDRPSEGKQTFSKVLPNNIITSKKLNFLIEAEANDIEHNISKIFYDILGTEKFSKNDNFFDLGGTSLSALKLISKLQLLDINPSINDVIKYNSVFMLSNYNNQPKKSEKIIIPLKINRNSNKNVFLIHPVGGTLILYNEMIGKLNPAYNYYGIQNIDNNGKIIANADTLEQLSTIYVNEITKIQSHGSFTLMGSSLGGTIAYEMAKQLKAMNNNINFIAMFDAWAFFSESFHNQDIFNEAMVSQMKNDLIQFSYSLTDLKIDNKFLIENICKARWKLMTLLLNYITPKFDSKIDIHLFKSMTLDKHHSAHGIVVDNGWQKYIISPVQIYDIPGDHTSILRKPGVDKIISILNSLLVENKNSQTIIEDDSIKYLTQYVG